MQERVVRGSALRTLRIHAGLRVNELARSVGITADYLSKIERLDQQPSDVVAHRLARSLTAHTGESVAVEDFSDPIVLAAS